MTDHLGHSLLASGAAHHAAVTRFVARSLYPPHAGDNEADDGGCA